MDKQTIMSEYRGERCTCQDVAGGAVCLSEPTTTGRPEDKFLENTLIFDVSKGISLTKREGEILRRIVSGQTNKQIAQSLSRSERTVEFHRNRLMRKIGAHNAAELVKIAMGYGVVLIRLNTDNRLYRSLRKYSFLSHKSKSGSFRSSLPPSFDEQNIG